MSLEKQNIESVLPTTAMQAGMLYHSLAHENSGSYVQILSTTLGADLNTDCWKLAWDKVCQALPTMRTSFAWEKQAKPLQVIFKKLDFPWHEDDLSKLDCVVQGLTLDNLIAGYQQDGFLLKKAPLMHFSLLSLGDKGYRFIWCHHHLLLDGWSLPIVMSMVLSAYQELLKGNRISLDQQYPHKPYFDWLQRRPSHEGFWSENLHQVDFSRKLATRLIQQSEASLATKYVNAQHELSETATQQLHEAASRAGVTLAVFVESALGLLLQKYIRSHDFVIGTVVSGRPSELSDMQHQVGMFINTLPLRFTLDPSASVRDLLSQVQQSMLGLLERQDSDLMSIAKWCAVLPSESLFEVIFAFENYPIDSDLERQEASVSIKDVSSIERTGYPLTISAGVGDTLLLKASSLHQVFSQQEIERFLSYFASLLVEMAEDLDRDINRLAVMNKMLQAELVSVQTAPVLAGDLAVLSLDQLFSNQVRNDPQAIAIHELFDSTGEAYVLTYEMLNQQVNQRAWQLYELGVVPADWVAFRLERGAELIITLLAISRLGACYVPIDLSYPTERVKNMLHNSGVSLLLTSTDLMNDELLKSDDLPKMVAIDDLDDECLIDRGDIPRGNALSPAYMMFSSGSTGKPKGIVVNQQGIIRLVCNNNFAQVKAGSKVAQASNTSFDAATFEIWGAFLNGATLVMIPRKVSIDPELLAKTLNENSIDTMVITTSLFNQLVVTREDAFKGLEYVLVGGEEADSQLMQRLANSDNAPAHLLNMYGPTENTTYSTYFEVKKNTSYQASLPIGQAISGTTCYVLDKNLELVAPGLIGELYVGGLGVAQAYQYQPSLTASKFIPHPFSHQQGERLYATGDGARWNLNGVLEFVGRLDSQIKLRGFRIELGAITAAISLYSGVDQAHTVFDTKNKAIVAYWRGSSSIERASLWQYLATQLADYEIPSALMYVKQLPLNANGKIDAKRLPAPTPMDFRYQASDGNRITHLVDNHLFSLVSQVWCSVLKLRSVGGNDDFFAMGGHSLLATQMVTRLQKQLDLGITVKHIFEASVLNEFVHLLDDMLRAQHGNTLPMIKPIAEYNVPLDAVPISFAQQRLWFMEKMNPLSPAYYINMALRMEGNLDLDSLQHCFNILLQRHSILRSVYFENACHGVSQRILTVTELPLETADLRGLGDIEQEKVLQQELVKFAERQFDLERDLMLRVRLITLSDTCSILAITVHHIAADGWSLGIFSKDLGVLYKACIAEKSNGLVDIGMNVEQDLPSLSIDYRDFAYWQRVSLQDVLDTQLIYWKRQLANLPSLELLESRERPEFQTYRGGVVKVELNKGLAQGLKALCQKQDVTMYMALLGAYQSLLSRISGQTDIAVGSPIANRNHSGLENLVGFFVNMLVMRTDLNNDPNYLQVLKNIRKTALDAYANQDLPFEKIVEALKPKRDSSKHPLFQIHFALQNAPSEALELPDLTISPMDGEINWVRFDLECHLWQNLDGSIRGYWLYNRDLFDEETISRFTQMYQSLIESWLESPKTPLSAVRLSQPQPQQQPQSHPPARISVSEPPHNYHHSLPRLFAETVSKHYQQVALTSFNSHMQRQSISYGELDEQSNVLAHYLKEHGVGPEVHVGLMCQRSADLLCGLLAILKAGGVYVPLDPEYPTTRLQYMIEDSKPLLILCDQDYSASISVIPTVNIGEVIAIHHARLEWHSPPFVSIHTDSAAYVIYTSGSTGKPKGVVVSHRQVLRLITSGDRVFDFNSQDVWTLFHSYAFDFSVWEIWGAWAHGARLLVIPKTLSRSPSEFLDLLEYENVTVLNQTPTAFYSLIAADQALSEARRLSLRWVVFGGEALDFQRLRSWVERYGCKGDNTTRQAPRLMNMYGITETTVHVTYLELDAQMVRGTSISHIGQGLIDLQLYILDAAMTPVPDGVIGELYVAGEGISRGYFGQSSLTARHFVPNPFSDSGSRLYRTGDLIQRNARGELQYIGRSDQQIQLRGFRIELEEIESCLSAHPQVASAAVSVFEKGQNNALLVAYVVPKKVTGSACDYDHEILESWKSLYENTYDSTVHASTYADDFDITGWNSSYTREAIPEDQMREWLDERLARILSFSPKQVLEIGCGSGMIMHGIAPHVESYHGFDLSEKTIAKLQQQASDRNWAHVCLHAGSADDLTCFSRDKFDLVVINSVTQYFPNEMYLRKVIQQAMEVLVPGGVLFIGDVRDFSRLQGFYASIVLYHAKNSHEAMSKSRLDAAVLKYLALEEELAISPALFADLGASLDTVDGFSVDYQGGYGQNEMLHYRYDVCLWKNGSNHKTPDILPSHQRFSSVSAMLRGGKGGALIYLPLVLDARVVDEYQALGLVEADNNNTIHPEDLRQQAKALGYHIRIMPCAEQPAAFSALLFNERELGWAENQHSSRLTCSIHKLQSWALTSTRATNVPQIQKYDYKLIDSLKVHVKAVLPEHMRPAIYNTLEALPLTINGKLDRTLLPEPNSSIVIEEQDRQLPEGEIEQKVHDIWCSLLGLEVVSTDVTFFDAGGHSLLATQLLSRVKDEFHCEMSLRHVFDHPTIQSFAKIVREVPKVIHQGRSEIAPSEIKQFSGQTTVLSAFNLKEIDLASVNLDELSDAEIDALFAAQLSIPE